MVRTVTCLLSAHSAISTVCLAECPVAARKTI
jgi:hypothetical protein